MSVPTNRAESLPPSGPEETGAQQAVPSASSYPIITITDHSTPTHNATPVPPHLSARITSARLPFSPPRCPVFSPLPIWLRRALRLPLPVTCIKRRQPGSSCSHGNSLRCSMFYVPCSALCWSGPAMTSSAYINLFMSLVFASSYGKIWAFYFYFSSINFV